MGGREPASKSAGKAHTKAGGQEGTWTDGGHIRSMGHEVGGPEVGRLSEAAGEAGLTIVQKVRAYHLPDTVHPVVRLP